MFSKTSFLIIFLVFIFLISHNALAKKDIVLNLGSAYPKTIPILGIVPQELKNMAEGVNSGIKVKIHEPGTVVKKTYDLAKEVSKGKKVNAAYTSAGFWSKSISPAAALFGAFPFGPNPTEHIGWILEGDGLKLWQEMYDRYGYNIKVFPCGLTHAETLWFAKPVKTIKDLKGIRMRIFGLGGEVLKKFGVIPFKLAPDQIIPHLKQGKVDTVEFSMPAIDEGLGIADIVKFNYVPGWHQPACMFELIINKTTWKSMSKGQQELIKQSCLNSVTKQLAMGDALNFLPMKRNIEQKGVKIIKWSPEFLKQFKGAWRDVVKDLEKDEFFKRVWDNLSDFRQNYKLWYNNSRLVYPKK